VFGFFTEGRGLAPLLRHPGVGRMGQGVDMDDLPRPQMDDDKGIEGLEEQSDGGYEVAGRPEIDKGLSGPRSARQDVLDERGGVKE
jgi:hypothetical protein